MKGYVLQTHVLQQNPLLLPAAAHLTRWATMSFPRLCYCFDAPLWRGVRQMDGTIYYIYATYSKAVRAKLMSTIR